MRVGSLFSGIGGIDLGLQRAGFEIAWQVEIDEYCRKVLGQHWPEVRRFEDVRSTGRHAGDIHTCYIQPTSVDILAGGFPCQDISSAGKRAGIEGERSGLWKEFARIIKEIRPRYVLIENVAALLYANKTCNGERREAAIATVLRDLAAIGFDAEWRVFSAAEFGAPHLRRRVFIVAYPTIAGQQEWKCTTGLHGEFDPSGSTLAHADRARLEIRNGREPGAHEDSTAVNKYRAGALESGICRDAYGISRWMDGIEHRWPAGPGEEQYEWEPLRVIEGKLVDRVARLKGLGNSALPQIAEAIGYAIRRFDQARAGE